MAGIESQLMGLHMGPGAEPDESGDAGEDNNDEEEDELEIEPVKLFVGQVRNIMNSIYFDWNFDCVKQWCRAY